MGRTSLSKAPEPTQAVKKTTRKYTRRKGKDVTPQTTPSTTISPHLLTKTSPSIESVPFMDNFYANQDWDTLMSMNQNDTLDSNNVHPALSMSFDGRTLSDGSAITPSGQSPVTSLFQNFTPQLDPLQFDHDMSPNFDFEFRADNTIHVAGSDGERSELDNLFMPMDFESRSPVMAKKAIPAPRVTQPAAVSLKSSESEASSIDLPAKASKKRKLQGQPSIVVATTLPDPKPFAAPGEQPKKAPRQPRGQKISHNVIEKRYRSNLNDKIARLRDSVPALRNAAGESDSEDDGKMSTPLSANAPGNAAGATGEGSGAKVNKATVLVKATEYIAQLEREREKLMLEVQGLRKRVESNEKEMRQNTWVDNSMGSTTSLDIARPVTSDLANSAPAIKEEKNKLSSEEINQTFATAKGLIPTSISSIQNHPRQPAEAAQTSVFEQPHYAPSHPLSQLPRQQGNFDNQDIDTFGDEEIDFDESSTSGFSFGLSPRASKTASRILIGSLACLMVMEGLSESEQDSSSHFEKRGLFALPTDLVTESRGFRSQIRERIIAFAGSRTGQKVMPLLMISIMVLGAVLGVLWYVSQASNRKTARQRSILHTDLPSIRISAPPDDEKQGSESRRPSVLLSSSPGQSNTSTPDIPKRPSIHTRSLSTDPRLLRDVYEKEFQLESFLRRHANEVWGIIGRGIRSLAGTVVGLDTGGVREGDTRLMSLEER